MTDLLPEPTILAAALRTLADAAVALSRFLEQHAPGWQPYAESVRNHALDLSEGEMSLMDRRRLRDTLSAPFRGTMGSMNELYFETDELDHEYRALRGNMFAAFTPIEQLFARWARAERMVRPPLRELAAALAERRPIISARICEMLEPVDLDPKALADLVAALAELEPHIAGRLASILYRDAA
jgi:hypothetical protein